MQRVLVIVILCACIVASCKKAPGVTTRMLLHNATLTIDSLSMLWNGTTVTSSALAQGKTSGTVSEPYLTIPAGTNNIILKSGSTTLLDKNVYGGVNTSYTLLAYDSTTSASSLNVILLTDDLSFATDSVSPKYRFINCSYGTAIDSVKLRNAADTVSVSTITFIGPSPTASTVQVFTTLTAGTYQPLVFSGGVAKAYDSVALSAQKICSLIYSGKPGSTGADSLKLAVIFHPVK